MAETITIDAETRAALDQLAAEMSQTPEAVLRQALAVYRKACRDRRLRDAIGVGLGEADRGEIEEVDLERLDEDLDMLRAEARAPTWARICDPIPSGSTAAGKQR